MTAQKLCETVGVDWVWTEYDELDPVEKQAWLRLFVEALMNHVITTAE